MSKEKEVSEMIWNALDVFSGIKKPVVKKPKK